MRKPVETMLRMVLVTVLAVSLAACAAKRPPRRIQLAIQTMNRHMPSTWPRPTRAWRMRSTRPGNV